MITRNFQHLSRASKTKFTCRFDHQQLSVPFTVDQCRFSTAFVNKMPAKDKYTDPELREEVKKDIQDGDKGGAPGQWSARKVQALLVLLMLNHPDVHIGAVHGV